MMDGHKLLALFAILMMVVGALMLRDRARTGDSNVRVSRGNLPKLLMLGLVARTLSGFFGIGGGFLGRARADVSHRNAGTECNRFIAGFSHSFRADHSGQLCLVRTGGLAACRPLCSRRADWRPAWRARREVAFCPEGGADD